jgi:hypothetical protein
VSYLKRRCCVAGLVMFALLCFGQSGLVRSGRLTFVQKSDVKSELAGTFALPLKCDAKGAIYLRPAAGEGDYSIHKINPVTLQREATFPKGELPNGVTMKLPHYFDIDKDGGIHSLAGFGGKGDRYVVSFNPDGTVRSAVKLQTGFPWFAREIASFPSGGFLVAGERERLPGKTDDSTHEPFTGIFDSNGKLVTEVRFEDDTRLHRLAEEGDLDYVSPTAPTNNRAVTHGAVETGPDGNVYVMRASFPVIIYAVSPSGKVLRRFTVDPGDRNFIPLAPLHISGNGIAVLFHDDPETKQLVKIISLGGAEIASYSTGAGIESPGPTMACYSSQGEQFTFLQENDNGGYLSLGIFEPR